MVPRWKKLAYSLTSVLFASTTLMGLSLFLPGKTEDLFETFSVGTAVLFAVSLLGWLIASPLILIINNVSGWRFWLYMGIGSSIGPLLTYQGMILPFLRAYKGHYSQAPALLVVLGTSTLLSGLATLSYLLLLRRAQNRYAERKRLDH
jgi:hypothetical protein